MMTTSLDTIKAVGDYVTAHGWRVSLEFPGFLQHAKEFSPNDVLYINIGPSHETPATRWTADFERNDTRWGAWQIEVPTDATPDAIGERIVAALNKANFNERSFTMLTLRELLDIVSRAESVISLEQEEEGHNEHAELVAELRGIVTLCRDVIGQSHMGTAAGEVILQRGDE